VLASDGAERRPRIRESRNEAVKRMRLQGFSCLAIGREAYAVWCRVRATGTLHGPVVWDRRGALAEVVITQLTRGKALQTVKLHKIHLHVRRQHSWDRSGFLSKGGFLSHRNP